MGHKCSVILPTDEDTRITDEDIGYVMIGTGEYITEPSILTVCAVGAVLNLLTSIHPRTSSVLTRAGIDPEADFCHFPLEDTHENYMSIHRDDGITPVLAWIHRKRAEGKNVFVHCDAGSSTTSPLLYRVLGSLRGFVRCSYVVHHGCAMDIWHSRLCVPRLGNHVPPRPQL